MSSCLLFSRLVW